MNIPTEPVSAAGKPSYPIHRESFRIDFMAQSFGDRKSAESAPDSPTGRFDMSKLEASLAADSALETTTATWRSHLLSASSPPVKSVTHKRSGSNPGTSRAAAGSNGVASKAVQDSGILCAVRKQMELLEDKLSGQISMVQQQSDRLRDAALNRVDSKLNNIEVLQPKLDRRLAELSGNNKGLSDEMRAQVRRLDHMESHLWEWRRQFEEEVRGKLVEAEQSYQKVQTCVRLSSVANEDASRRYDQRMAQLECLLEEKIATSDEISNHVMTLQSRLDDIEQTYFQEISVETHKPLLLSESVGLNSDERATLLSVETRLSDARSKIEYIVRESNEMHTRMEAQEERLKSLHARVETKDEYHRWLNGRVDRFDVEGRFSEIQSQMQELCAIRIAQRQKDEVICRRLDKSDEAIDECFEQLKNLQAVCVPEARPSLECPNDLVGFAHVAANELLNLATKDCAQRIADLEVKLRAELAATDQADVALGSHLAELVEQLRGVAPKIMEQEKNLQQLCDKFDKLDKERSMDLRHRERLEGIVDSLQTISVNALQQCCE